MQAETIINHPNRIAANCQLGNLHLSYCSSAGKLDVLWLVFHAHSADETNNFSWLPHDPHMHKHMFYETHLCLRGWAKYQLADDEPVTVHAGEVLFIPPDCKHGCR